MSIDATFPKQFDHKEAEKRIFDLWSKSGVFSAKPDSSQKPFCVVIPPPNVTGILHMGHVLDNVPQDVMTRWHRMRGFSAVWIPGTDHAGIATQNVVKRQLDKDGVNYRELGREKFVERVWEWKARYGSIIIEQLKRLGCSCDWERERFTMDEHLSRAVLTAFIHYYRKGLIYKGKRMINWCTVCGTALSDDEVEHEEKDSHLWHLRYPILKDDGTPSGDVIVVATTRPETMLGDTAVAVHPEDERYKSLQGKKVLLPLQNRAIPVIADSFVDPAFGTGVVKVTPAHDPNDYQMGLTHKLPIEVVIGENGKMTAAAGAKYAGSDRFAARKAVLADLEAQGTLEKTEKHKHAVGSCYRCNSVLEPMISDQWFVKMRPLAERAKQAVQDGRIQIVPESEKHDYFHWMDTIQDWCISRQLWWGHRIPVYYCDSCGHQMAEMSPPQACERCKNTSLRQDEDVLDTWFSSQLWPFSTLGWPDKTPELKYWYPNSWLMSGRDILPFWDARMIMAGLELLDDVPFRTLALHGLVRDEKGRKLSKSLGNSPDPLALFEQYGTDAVRASISMRYPMGRQDTKLTGDFYKAGQGLITKIWNSSRFILMNLEGKSGSFDSRTIGKATIEDRWILSKLSAAIEAHDNFLSKSDIVHAFEAVNSFFWNEFCDWYVEIIKPRFRAGGTSGDQALGVALHCMRAVLRLFHPYLPFVTEELWQLFRTQGIQDAADESTGPIALSVWPTAQEFPRDAQADAAMDVMMSVVRAVRDVRANLQIGPKVPLASKLSFSEQGRELAQGITEIARSLGSISEFGSYGGKETPSGFVPFKFLGGIGYLALPADIDAKDLQTKLASRIAKLEKALSDLKGRLANPAFFENAPEALIAENQAKAHEYEDSLSKLQAFHRSLA